MSAPLRILQTCLNGCLLSLLEKGIGMSDEEAYSRCAVVLTAIPVEYQAVRAHLTNLRQEKHEKGNIYERGTFVAGKPPWEVGIVEVGVGNAPAAVQTERAINHFKPILILFVGVAGGLKDVKLGDVVVATKVYGYESGKANITFQPRPEVGNVPYRMAELARSEARARDWLKRLPKPIPKPSPRVFVAPIAAGGSVVTSTRSATWQLLKENYNDAVAVDMEGHGFLQAVYANPGMDALIIRGISDLIDNKSEVDAENFQELAVRHASAFAFEILAKLDSNRHLQNHAPGVITPASIEGQLEGELKGQEKTQQEQSKNLLSENTSNRLLDKLRDAISDKYDEIGEAFSPFDSGQDIYQDQCDRANEALNDLDSQLSSLSREAKILDLVTMYDLDNMENTLSALKMELHKLRALCPPRKTSIEQRQYMIEHEKIRNEKKNLLERLEQIKIRLSKDAKLE
jgi:nucleoside phosphorylase